MQVIKFYIVTVCVTLCDTSYVIVCVTVTVCYTLCHTVIPYHSVSHSVLQDSRDTSHHCFWLAVWVRICLNLTSLPELMWSPTCIHISWHTIRAHTAELDILLNIHYNAVGFFIYIVTLLKWLCCQTSWWPVTIQAYIIEIIISATHVQALHMYKPNIGMRAAAGGQYTHPWNTCSYTHINLYGSQMRKVK